MKIAAIGHGPASLLLGLALKRRRPTAAVTILRQPPPATVLPGIAFSAQSRRQIVARLAELLGQELPLKRWAALTVFSGGAEFCLPAEAGAISLASLESLLEAAAAAAGCTIQLRHGPVAEEELVGFDLVALETPAAQIAARVPVPPDAGAAQLAVFTASDLAADQVYEVAELGGHFFFGHGFVFAEQQAVYFVEAAAEAWESRGLAGNAGTALETFAAATFARSLAGAAAASCGALQPLAGEVPQRWRAGNNVLVGGSAETVHPSFLFRAELALDDALALADALSAAGTVEEALTHYEAQRRRVAASGARAAAAMIDWSANLRRYTDFTPLQLSFSLLTRSLRTNHRDLERLAPAYVQAVDRSFAGLAGEAKAPPPMFTPLTLRGLTIPNRIGFSPMCMYSAQDGMPSDFHLVHIGSRAMGGAGLVFTEMTDVSPEGRCTPGCAGFYDPTHVAGWRRVVDYVHAQTPAKIAIQLGHAGRRAATARPWEGGTNIPALQDAWETIAPSALSYAESLPIPREMNAADMRKVVEDYQRATRWSVEAGFDLLEIHMAHGYLFSTFLSPLSNRRTDAFGGPLEHRARFPLEVTQAVRAAWPAERPLSVRISAVDWSPGGSTISEMVTFSHMLKEAGVDIIDVSTGNVVNVRRPATGRLFQTPFSDQIRNEVKIPTMTVGRIISYGDIDAVLAAGRADLCLLAKAHLDDPYFARHAARALGHRDLVWPEPYDTVADFRFRREG